jgi:prepilin-type processing-associated H-X9-DG protein
METSSTHQKYQELILTAQSSGVMKPHVREFNNILYVDGHVPCDKVKQELWNVYNKIDPGYRSGDLVLSLHSISL